jgi:hypothetical protein
MRTPKPTALDRQWASLMALCESEASLKTAGPHPKLLKLVGVAIREVAEKMGFSERQIRTREFRAERERGHIVRVVVE